MSGRCWDGRASCGLHSTSPHVWCSSTWPGYSTWDWIRAPLLPLLSAIPRRILCIPSWNHLGPVDPAAGSVLSEANFGLTRLPVCRIVMSPTHKASDIPWRDLLFLPPVFSADLRSVVLSERENMSEMQRWFSTNQPPPDLSLFWLASSIFPKFPSPSSSPPICPYNLWSKLHPSNVHCHLWGRWILPISIYCSSLSVEVSYVWIDEF